jgi:phosphohistidine phosphatase
MLIGHNPALGWLAAELAGNVPDAARIRVKYPTGALASFAFGGDWSRLAPQATTIERFLTPKELG